jgi:hypothetical protein
MRRDLLGVPRLDQPNLSVLPGHET